MYQWKCQTTRWLLPFRALHSTYAGPNIKRLLDLPESAPNSQSVQKSIQQLKSLLSRNNDGDWGSDDLAIKHIERLAKRATISPRLRHELVPAFLAQSELTPLRSHFYVTFLKLLISKNDPDTANAFVLLSATPNITQALVLDILVYACTHSNPQIVVDLAANIPTHLVSSALVDRFLLQCYKTRVPLSSPMFVVLEQFVQQGLWPKEPLSFDILSRYLDACDAAMCNNIMSRFNSILYKYAEETGLTKLDAAWYSRWAALVAKHNNADFIVICTLCEALEKHSTVIKSQTFWQSVISHFHKTPVSAIVAYMMQRKIPVADKLGIKLAVCERNANSITDVEWIESTQFSSEHLYSRAFSLYLKVYAQHSEPDLAKSKFQAIYSTFESQFPQKLNSSLPTALLTGWTKARKYSDVVSFFESEKFTKSNASWNIYVSALCKVGLVNKAWKCAEWMYAKNIGFHLLPDTVASLVVGSVRANPSTVYERLYKTMKWGSVFPVTRQSALLGHLCRANLSYTVFRRVLFQLVNRGPELDNIVSSKPVSEFANIRGAFIPSASQLHELALRNSTRVDTVLTHESISEVVACGFIKCPQTPWVGLQDLYKLKQMGIIVPDEVVRTATLHQLRNIYGKKRLTGQDKRTREHVGRFFPLNELLTHCNKAWGDHILIQQV